MKKYMALITFFILCFSLYFIYQAKISSIPGISFFPLDKESSFTDANTNLNWKHKNGTDNYIITWNSMSKSDRNMYLREDVSLLFTNGKLLGAQSKWQENEGKLLLSEEVETKGPAYFQALSYHHGEIHYPNGTINSIQHMTNDDMYVVGKSPLDLHAFHKPATAEDIEWKKKLTNQTSQTLLYQWNDLLNHYQINKEAYQLVPLTSLFRYNTKPLPGLSSEQTNQVIGQLWEGLYKSYILPITYGEKQVSSFVPLVLFSKDNKHLLVLFEINGKKERLIQRYSF